jgi:PAS domain S-box-containing protein
MIRRMAGEAAVAKELGNPLDLRTLIDTIPALVVCALPDGSLEFVNQTWREYTGYPLEQLTGWGWQTVIHPDDISKFMDEWNAARAAGKPFENEVRVRRADGEYRWFLVRKVPHRDASGHILRWLGTGQDIQELRIAEARLRIAVDTAPALIHSARPDGYIDFLNKGWLEYVGLPMEDLEGWLWTKAFHPDDVEPCLTKWHAALASGEPFEAESRVRRADGEYRTMIHRKLPLRDGQGNIVKWYGSGIDIEDRKRAEERIRLQEIELRQVVDLAPQHVAVLGPDGTRLYLNQSGLDYYGQTLEEWRSCDLNILIHPDEREPIVRLLQGQISGALPHEAEARLLSKDGKYRWFLVRLNALRDEHGKIMRWYVAAIDIEDRKQAEQRLQDENVALREEIDKASMFEEIVGTAPALRAVLSRVSKVAPTDSTVLLTGETGTGKELVARAIHRRSRRASRAFVSVNCAAIPRDLIASELFGHEKGAFTGAAQLRLGRFELAGGGTIFLDEVGELPAETQVALLRVLQEREFERVGGTRSIQTDVRVIAATNRDLKAAIASGVFRSDLFYRLNVFPMELPPLRNRREDIPLLVEYFIDRFARKAGKNVRGVNKKTLDLLQSYPWPGNIRELQNVIERSMIVCDSENFCVDESWISRPPQPTGPASALDLSERLAAQEKEIIEAALQECGGRVFGPTGAAAKLGVPRSTLESKIRSLKIGKIRFKRQAP